MKNKKAEGFLEEHTLNIIIAVICILVLIGLIIKIYSLSQTKSDSKIAEKVLNELINAIKALKEGEKGDYLAIGPKDWFIVDYKQGTDLEIPKQCKSQSCLCMCPASTLQITSVSGFKAGGGTENCDKNGLCILMKDFVIKEPFFSNDAYYLYTWISLHEVPETIYLKKTKEGKVFLSQMEIDSKIMSDFLAREVLFEGQGTSVEELTKQELTSGCKLGSEQESILQKEAPIYLNEVINNKINRMNGGRIEYCFSGKDGTSYGCRGNGIFRVEQDFKEENCWVVENKEMCEKKEGDITYRGYFRIWSCK